VQRLGYEIDNGRDSKGRDSGFQIRGVPEELLEWFSQRSRQRDQAIEAFVREHGRKPTDNEVAVLVRESRADKLLEISTGELRARQRSRLTPHDEHELATLRPDSLRVLRREAAAPSLDHAKDYVFERVSIAADHEVLTEALRHRRGCIQLNELKGVLA
jgi:hypothetical protein